MDLGSIFLIIALLCLVALYIVRPLLEVKPPREEALKSIGEVSREDQKHSALLAERDRVLNALSELDFDYAVGKIPDEDYPSQRSALMEHGVKVLRELDTFEPEYEAEKMAGTSPAFANPELSNSAEARLEAAIAARRLVTASAGGPAPTNGPGPNGGEKPAADDDIEIQIAARRRLRQDKAAGFCPQCGGPVQKSDRFCPKCGAPQKNSI